MNNENIQEFIKNLRKEKHLTQKELADILGVTYQAVSKWERGLNYPDLSILKEISRIFDVDMDTIINGKVSSSKNKKKKNNFLLIFLLILVVITFCFSLFLFYQSHDFTFQKISSDCEDFTLKGSVVYNEKKSSIYISSIEYCGDVDDRVYSRIEYDLYEESNESRQLIQKGDSSFNTSLESFLKNLEIHVEKSNDRCGIKDGAKIYLEIRAIQDNGEVNLYQVPIKLDGDCK